MKITIRLLKSKGACSEQLEKFKELFPKGVVLTEALCIKHANEFDWDWSAENLLTPTARKLYDETRAPAWTLYVETDAPGWTLYNETCAPARKLYDETCATARKLYVETRATARKLYDETRAPAFARAYLSDENMI